MKNSSFYCEHRSRDCLRLWHHKMGCVVRLKGVGEKECVQMFLHKMANGMSLSYTYKQRTNLILLQVIINYLVKCVITKKQLFTLITYYKEKILKIPEMKIMHLNGKQGPSNNPLGCQKNNISVSMAYIITVYIEGKLNKLFLQMLIIYTTHTQPKKNLSCTP